MKRDKPSKKYIEKKKKEKYVQARISSELWDSRTSIHLASDFTKYSDAVVAMAQSDSKSVIVWIFPSSSCMSSFIDIYVSSLID